MRGVLHRERNASLLVIPGVLGSRAFGIVLLLNIPRIVEKSRQIQVCRHLQRERISLEVVAVGEPGRRHEDLQSMSEIVVLRIALSIAGILSGEEAADQGVDMADGAEPRSVIAVSEGFFNLAEHHAFI